MTKAALNRRPEASNSNVQGLRPHAALYGSCVAARLLTAHANLFRFPASNWQTRQSCCKAQEYLSIVNYRCKFCLRASNNCLLNLQLNFLRGNSKNAVASMGKIVASYRLCALSHFCDGFLQQTRISQCQFFRVRQGLAKHSGARQALHQTQ